MNLTEALDLVTPCHPSRLLFLAIFRPFDLSLAVATIKACMEEQKKDHAIARKIDKYDHMTFLLNYRRDCACS